MTRLGILAVLLFVMAGFAVGQQPIASAAPEGIPRELARSRAQQLKDIRYQLTYMIGYEAESVSGYE